MLVYIWRDDQLHRYPMKFDKDSPSDKRKRVVEIPDELVERHDKALAEFQEVQKLLSDFLDRENG